MSKDPAFLFYPNDYIGGTMGWTFEEKGAYIELLMMQFNRGHMTEHMARHTVGQLWDIIKVKFQMDDDGLYYNARLEFEQNKRKSFVASRHNNLGGKNQHSHKKGHTTSLMENENEIENRYGNRVLKSWQKFKKFRKDQHNFRYKSPESEKGAFTTLEKLSTNPETMVLIIEQTIANGWKGFFEIKKERKGNTPAGITL